MSPEPRATGTPVPARLPAPRRAPPSRSISEDYNVTEDFEDSASSPLKVVRNFSAGCSGSIETAGEGRVCNVTNEFVQKEYLFLSKWGSLGTGNGQFDYPIGVAVNPSTGNVYVADTGNNRIQVFDGSGTFITKFGTLGNGDGQFNLPLGVAVNPTTGNVYVADTETTESRCLTPAALS